jgi:ubiquinone/menaquinone biosynthesis C-methylase UbiE
VLVPPRHRGPELLDDQRLVAASRDEVAESFREIRRLNRISGASWLVIRQTRALLPPSRGSVLDVGTGTADTPLAMLRWAARHGIHLSVTGLDVSPTMLEEARRLVGDAPVSLVQGDARRLPFVAEEFDVAVSLGVLHHFDEEDAVQVLREMWRVSRFGIVVTDLERSYLHYWLARLSLRFLTHNRFTRQDGALSVLRAYTPDELRRLAERAGIPALSVRRHLPVLQVLLARKVAHGP